MRGLRDQLNILLNKPLAFKGQARSFITVTEKGRELAKKFASKNQIITTATKDLLQSVKDGKVKK